MATTVEPPEGASRNRRHRLDGGARLADRDARRRRGDRRSRGRLGRRRRHQLGWLVLALVWLAAAFGIRRRTMHAAGRSVARMHRGRARDRRRERGRRRSRRLCTSSSAGRRGYSRSRPSRRYRSRSRSCFGRPRRFEASRRAARRSRDLARGPDCARRRCLPHSRRRTRPRLPPTSERTLLVLSIVAAAISALLYVPARRRLADFSSRLVHGARQPPDELVRTFGARLSRALPLDELLLQLAESLRSAFALEAAEIWTGSGGVLERVVSEPDRGPATLRLTASEEAVVARTRRLGTSPDRRLAPATARRSRRRGRARRRDRPLGRAVRPDRGRTRGARQSRSTSRQRRSSPSWHASSDSRSATSGSTRTCKCRSRSCNDRRRSYGCRERASWPSPTPSDGGSSATYTTAPSSTSSGWRQTSAPSARSSTRTPSEAKAVLGELRTAVQEAMQDFRDLAHGIYPPLLQDRGLSEALANAARRTTIPTRLEAAERPSLRTGDRVDRLLLLSRSAPECREARR